MADRYRPWRPITRRSLMLAGGAALTLAQLPRLAHSAADGLSVTLTAGAGRAQLLPKDKPSTAVWNYNGSVPGPILRLPRGSTLSARLVNELPQPTTIHWHGIRIDNAMDGVAGLTQAPAQPGEVFDYRFVVPDAGTFWYHPHNRSWEQVARGLYGLLVVDEDDPPTVDQDLALVVDDWRLDEAGAIHEASFGHMRDWSHAGRLGNTLTLNGEDFLEMPVKAGERIRLRLCNTATARIMNLRFEDHNPVVIAYDGQPVAPHQSADGVFRVAPGERIDVMIDMMLEPGATAAITEVTGDGRLVAGHFLYHPEERRRSKPLDEPPGLPANPLDDGIDLADAIEVPLVMAGGAMGGLRQADYKGETLSMRELVQRGQVWAFNGIAGRPEEPLFHARLGQTVRIRMVNDTAWPHAIHLHGHHVRLVDGNGAILPEQGWRDTVLLERHEERSVAFVADNPGKWMIHCHMLEHQAAGMASWFVVEA